MRRRRFLETASAVGLAGVAGCSSRDADADAAPGSPTESGTTDEPGASPANGTPAVGGDPIELPWTQLPGPSGGPVMDIALSAADPESVYVTTQTSGAFASSDGGASWIQGLSRTHHRQRVWASPHDPDVAYIHGERTPDGGYHWYDRFTQAEYRFPPIENIDDMAWDPTDGETLYAVSAGGFFRSFDGGRNWERRRIVEGEPEIPFVDVHPDAGGVVVASVSGHGVARSRDRGETWSMIPETGDLPDLLFRGLTYRPGTDELYLALNGGGVYRLRDGELAQVTESLVLPWWTEQLHFSADGRTLYFVAGRRTGGGFERFWERPELFVYDVPAEDLSVVDLPEPSTAVATHPHDPSTLYFGGIEWVWESTDGGETWQSLSNGFVDHYLATVGTNPERAGAVVAGSICSTGVSVSEDRGESWEWKRSGLEPFHEGVFDEHYVMQIAANGDRAYATTAAGLLVSEDGGDTWRLLDNEFSGAGNVAGGGDDLAKHLHGLAVDPEDPAVVYVGTGLGGAGGPQDHFDGESFVWKSRDGGDTWRQITDGFPTGRDTVVQDVLVSEHDPDVLYLGTNDEDYLAGGKGRGAGEGLGVFRSRSAGEGWEQLETPFRTVHALAEDATDAETLFASSPEGIYRSADAGGSWKRVLPYPTKALLAHPEEAGVVFAASQFVDRYWDVLVSTDRGETWREGNLTIRMGTEPDERPYDAAELHSDYTNDNGEVNWFAFDAATSTLYGATKGTGLWRAETGRLES